MNLPISLAEVVVIGLIDATKKAHKIAADGHDPDEGFDNHTYGTTAYRLTWFLAENYLEDMPEVSTTRRIPGRGGESLTILAGGYTISVYTGSSAMLSDPHAYDFGRTKQRSDAATSNGQTAMWTTKELDLLLPKVTDPAKLKNLHFVHVGNPELGGCQAMYLGAPATLNGGMTWAWVETVWTPEAGTPAVPIAPSRPDTPHHDELEQPSLDIHLRSD